MAIRLVQLLINTGTGDVSEERFVVVRPNEVGTLPIQPVETKILEIPVGIRDSALLSDWLINIVRPAIEEMGVALANLPLPVPKEEVDDKFELQEVLVDSGIKTKTAEISNLSLIKEQNTPTYNQILNDLRIAIQYHGVKHAFVNNIKERLITHQDHDSNKMDRCIAESIELRTAIENLNRAAGDRTISDEEYTFLENKFLKRYKWMKKKAEKIRNWRTGIKARVAVNSKAKKAGISLSTVKPGQYSHKIGELSPHKAWTLYIDETGDKFDSVAEGGREGRMVGVLFPSDKLPSIPANLFHGTDATAAVADAMVQTVLDSECGVFGIGNSGLPQTSGERWVSGVLEVVQWVARLLPMDGATVLNVAIEQRGDYSSSVSWKLLEAPILRELVERDPVRYRNLRVQLQVFAKKQEPRLSYADSIAFSWGSKSDECKERIRRSLLIGGCLIEGNAQQLRRAWDQFSSKQGMDGSDWASIVSSADARVPNSIIETLLTRYGESVRKHPELWQKLLKYTLAYLDGKAVYLPQLRQEIDWLTRYQPDGENLPKTIEFAWKVGRLSTANHEGRTGEEDDARIEALGKELFNERPELVCLGDLYRSVLATNRFDYEAAARALLTWQDAPVAVPGLQMWGRVQSSLGQIAAFQGNLKRAMEYFDRAIDAFKALSDPEARVAEEKQTATYAAIASMDDPSIDISTVKERLSKVFKLDAETVRALAANEIAEKKYAHYLLLRYLVTRGDNLLEEAYLSVRDNWSYSEGHPAPLIDAYRSHLIKKLDPERAKALAQRAIDECFNNDAGPTLVVIGSAIAIGSRNLGGISLPNEMRLDELQSAFPGAPDLIARLLSTPDDYDLPSTLARILPFNFR